MKIASPGATSRVSAWPVPTIATDSLATITSRPVGPVAFAERERPDAERVAEREQAVAGDQRDDRVRAPDALVHGGDRGEHLLGRELPVARRALELVREDVDQHLGVAAGVDVAPVDVEQLLLQRLRVGQVAVVDEHDAVRRVDVERLRLFLAVGVAGGRIAHLAEADVARQRRACCGCGRRRAPCRAPSA